jgi:hypothetical protein
VEEKGAVCADEITDNTNTSDKRKVFIRILNSKLFIPAVNQRPHRPKLDITFINSFQCSVFVGLWVGRCIS